MNILLVTNNLTHRDPGFYTLSVARGLQEANHSVTVAAPPDPLVRELKMSEIPVHTFPFLKDPRLELFKTRAFCSKLDDPSFDLIHAHDLSLSSFIEDVGRRLDLPCFLTIHAFEENPEELTHHSSHPTGVITPNEALREHAVNDLGISKSLVEVIQPGVNLDRLRSGSVLRNGMKPVVAMSTPLVPENQVELFPKVARRILNDGHEPTFLVLSEGEAESDLRRLVDEMGLSDEFVFHSNPDVYFEVLPDIDVLLSTEPRLELGILILQAMGCGKPVITCGAGGAYHVVVDQETGYLVSLSDSPADMVDKLSTLLDNPETARKIGEQAREHVEDHFSAERMTQETISFFNRYLSD